MAFADAVIKGEPIRVLYNRSKNGLSDVAVPCKGFNAVNVFVMPTGSSPSATVGVEGSYEEGGIYNQLPDSQASQSGVTSNKMFEVAVGTAWVKIRLSDISGTFGNNEGFTVIVTPFVSPGQTSISISNTAAQNLAQVGGSAITAEDVDTDAGDSRNALPVALMLPGATPVAAPGDGSNGVDVDVTRVQGTVTVDSELPAAAALADGAANPTAPTVGAGQEVFNGTSWDRARSVAASGAGLGVQQVGTLGELITLAASAARTAGGEGTPVTGLGWRNRFLVLLEITESHTEAGDTLDVYVDFSLDGATWLNAVHFTQQAGDGAARKEFAVLDPSNPGTSTVDVTGDAAAGAVRPAMFGPRMRARWAIADSGNVNSSHTFSVVAFAI